MTSTWSEKWGSYIEYVSCQMQKGLSAVHLPREVCLYRMAGSFGGKIFWRIAENMSFGGIYFGS